jgi:hypothetical protein
LGKNQSAFRQTVQIGGFDKLIPHEADVAPAHIIHQDEKNIRLAGIRASGFIAPQPFLKES